MDLNPERKLMADFGGTSFMELPPLENYHNSPTDEEIKDKGVIIGVSVSVLKDLLKFGWPDIIRHFDDFLHENNAPRITIK